LIIDYYYYWLLLLIIIFDYYYWLLLTILLVNFVDYIYSLNPKRIIFNPGAENPDFFKDATQKGIECIEGCTLVMLSIGNY
jgi:hypothetical protein